MSQREEAMLELLRAKRAADTKFRKVRLAFEGPKRPVKKATTSNNADDKDKDAEIDKSKNTSNNDADDDNDKDEKEEPKEERFKPTATKKQFEAARKAQQKASDAYEKGIRKLVARTEPIGYDRDFNAVYCFRHDPEILYVEELKPPAVDAPNLPKDLQFARRSWHVIETTSLFDKLVSSLDIRGKRENGLYEELLGPQGAGQSLRRYLHDDLKERAQANSRLKEMEALKKRLQIARRKCDEDQGRRSGRLAGQAESELSRVEKDIEDLQRRIDGEQVEKEERDYEELTGLTQLRKFDNFGRVETRRSRVKKEATKVNSLQCSKLVSSGNIDGTGIVGMLVAELLELEERCEALAPREGNDRASWISQLEGAVHSWNSSITPANVPLSTPGKRSSAWGASSSQQSKRDADSAVSENSSKKRRTESPSAASAPSQPPISIVSVVAMLKQPLLQLEHRVADLTNLAMAEKDADLADDNMSTDSSEEDEVNKERLERAWKKKIHKMRQIPAKKHVQTRELLVSAIAAARKAHLPEIVSKLRAALLLYHPNAAGETRQAAIEILETNGDYDEDAYDDDSDSDDGEDDEDEDANEGGEKEEQQLSVVCAEAGIIRSSLGGSEEGSRSDWIAAVRSCKTVSRLASLTSGFIQDASEKIQKIEVEHEQLVDALAKWEKDEDRRAKKPAKSTFKEYSGPSEVWANVRFTDEICMAKAEDYPWWPAKTCTVKDPAVAESLSKVGRCLVSLVGEMGGLRAVKVDNLRPFSGKSVEDDDELVDFPKNLRSQLEDCLTMARRISRGKQKKLPSKKSRGSKG